MHTEESTSLRHAFIWSRRLAIGIGAVALIVAVIGAFFSGSEKFFRSYLFAWLFWFQIGFGSTAILMISFLTGGEWGRRTRRLIDAASRTQWVLAALFVPVLLGVKKIYPWTDAALVASDEKIKHKSLYLNAPFFCLRTLIYFTCWIWVARTLDSWGQAQLRESGTKYKDKLRGLSAGGLVLYGFSISFAAMDWQMSLEPSWYSTIYGMIFGASQLLGAWSFVLILFAWVAVGAAVSEDISKKLMRDLGNLLLTLVMTWAYLSFMQYLIIWSGNLPEEVTWVKHRVNHGWQWLAIAIVVFQFAAPFFLLLFRPVKTHPKVLAAVASVVLCVNVVDRYWQAMPAFFEYLDYDWSSAVALIGVGGLWYGAFVTYLLSRPISVSFVSEESEVLKHA